MLSRFLRRRFESRQAKLIAKKKRHLLPRAELLEPRDVAGSMLLSLPGLLETIPSARHSAPGALENPAAASLAKGRSRQARAVASPFGAAESDAAGASAAFNERINQRVQPEPAADGWIYAAPTDAYSAAGQNLATQIQVGQHNSFDWDILIPDESSAGRTSRLRDAEPLQLGAVGSVGVEAGGNGESGGGGGGSAAISTGGNTAQGAVGLATLPPAVLPAAANLPSAVPLAAAASTVNSKPSGSALSAMSAATNDAAGEAPVVAAGEPASSAVAAGSTSQLPPPVNLGFENGLTGWNLQQVGGIAPDQGTIRSGSMILREGNSFLVTASRSFTVPNDPSVVRFTYSELSFDTADRDSINDAFEAAVLDGDGRTLVFPFATGRDAFINFTEEEPVGAASGVVHVGGTVTADISALLPGTSATLVFRLVNNDHDENTTVHIETVDVFSGDAPPQVSASLANDTAPAGPGTDVFCSDGLTNDATIAGTVSDDIGIRRLEAQVDSGTFQDILPGLSGNQFRFDPGALVEGPHRVTIRATDTSGQSSQTLVDFRVNQPPVVSAGGNVTTNEGDVVALDGSQSSDAEAPFFAQVWAFDDGTTAAGPLASHTYAQDGVYSATFTVVDTAGSTASDTAQVTVNNLPPEILQLDNLSGVEDQPVDLLAIFRDPGILDTHTATIEWGDGGVDQAVMNEAAGQGTASGRHSYQTDGRYSGQLILRDGDGGFTTLGFTASIASTAHTLTARIDVVPQINLKSNGVIPVKVFCDPGFDCHNLDPASLRFGPGKAGLSGKLAGNSPQFVMTHFLVQQSGILPSDTVAYLIGRLKDGTPFIGMDTITIVGGGKSTASSASLSPTAPLASGPTSRHPLDINDDGHISPLDALVVINFLNGDSTAQGEFGAASTLAVAPAFYDTNGDGIVSPLDALLVINYLNSIPVEPTGAGKGESSSSLAQSSTSTTLFIDGPSPEGEPDAAQATAATQSIDFSVLSDVTASSKAGYARSSWSDSRETLYADLSLQNIGSFLIDGPLLVGVTNVSDPTVRVRDFDGLTPDGVPYFDFSNLLGDRVFSPGETSDARTLAFYDPDGQQFTYDLIVLGKLNQSPTIGSEPRSEALVGHRYAYAVQATDPDNDVLRFSLAANPAGMEIDQATGLITFTPAAGDVGTQSVMVEVSDSRGGADEQSYILTVADNVPNRPPVFTSSPLVDANINTSYQYQAQAIDADDDPLVFSLARSPNGMTIDGATGAIAWTPTASQLGSNAVEVSISDGRGGAAEQSFVIVVQPEAGNHAPMIVSEPVTKVEVPINPPEYVLYQYQVSALDSDADPVTYSLTQFPQGMSIDPGTGLISWLVTDRDVASHAVGVLASDVRGGTDTQSFALQVIESGTGEIHGTKFNDLNGNGVRLDKALLGPTPYLSRADSPFDLSGLGTSFFLEDFEDHQLNTPGLSVNNGIPASTFGGGIFNDSVDADDGVIDGSGTRGDSWFSGAVRFSFDPNVLGGFPTEAGLVWTDGAHGGTNITFEAFDAQGNSLGVIIGNHGDPSAFGETAEDRFYGVINPGGISALSVINATGGLEVDHVQYGRKEPEPGLPDWTIFLDQNENSRRDVGEPSAVTDGDGAYSFSDLAPGRYVVREEPQAGWRQTAPSPPGTQVVDLTDGQVATRIDFGNQAVPPAPNQMPSFSSQAPTVATVNRLYRYDAAAEDPENDPLKFDLVVKPDGMAVEPNLGIVVWRPTLDDLGVHDVILRVRDGRGGVALQQFQVTVALPNTAPVVVSKAPDRATANVPLAYQVLAQDAENDALTYRLLLPASGMVIDAASGLFRWTPTDTQVGQATATIVVTDAQGAEATQQLLITVAATSTNNDPVIVSSPRLRTGLQHPYLYQVEARDPDADPLTYSLSAAPAGMSIDTDGLIQWQPQPDQVGIQNVSLQVTDGRGGSVAQDFSIEAISQPVNSAPVITSQPPKTATVSEAFAYDATATDADHDPLIWSLDQAPAGMSIHPLLGTIRWTPALDQRGLQRVAVRVTDPLGGSTTQSFDLNVLGANVPPIIVSSPGTRAAVDQPYRYAPRAVDSNDDVLTFRLTTAPLGMTIDGASGVIDWTPTQDQLGTHDVALVVEDGQGGAARQLFRIVVAQTLNQPPTITSIPPTSAVVGLTYQYVLNAIDPDGDTLSFGLSARPDGMTINPTSGFISWVPQPGQDGQQTVTVQVADTSGAIGLQTFVINVTSANRFPILAGELLTAVAAGQLYRFNVPARDPDGDPLTFRIDTGPTGMTIDSFGRVLWQTTSDDVGDHAVQITIADNRGAAIELSYTITVGVDSQAPRVAVFLSENPINIGGRVSILARATDDIAVESLVVTVGGTPVPLDRNGRGTFQANHAGVFNVVATATDTSGNRGTAGATLQVRDPSDVNAPTVLITTPEDDAVVTTFADVIGTVNDDNLVSYTLAVAAADGGDFTEIASGTTPVVNGRLGRFDPTLLQNDAYILRLTAVDAAGNVSVDEQRISVRGNLKVGEFKLSFIDVNVPVLGVPILVARTYSSLDAAREQSLGFGWQLTVQDVDLRTNVPKTGDEADGVFNPFFQNARVYVTLPGGHREGFSFRPKVRFNLFGLTLYRPEFVPDAGVTSQLTVDPFDLVATSSGEFFGMAAGGLPYNPADSAFGGKYLLTTKEGLKYEIDGQSGDLRNVTTPPGDTLSFSTDQITSNSGVTVTLARDLRGRITSVTDPDGGTVRYAYDATGDLTKVTDRTGNVTRFEYSSSRPHYLEKIIDPLGRTGARVEYDADGRIVHNFDADGNEVRFLNDLANSHQTIVDQRGNPTTYEYDARGNIVTTIDPLGGITRRTYDENDYELTTTDPLGHTTTRTFDPRGNVLSETDALGNVSRSTFNGFSQSLTFTDPLGNVGSTQYTSKGEPRFDSYADGSFMSIVRDTDRTTAFVSDAAGTTRIQVDRSGEPIHEFDPVGGEKEYTRNANGNVLSETVFRTVNGVRQGLTTSHVYDASNRLIETRDPLGQVSRIEYDAIGRSIAKTDALGRRTTFEYDTRGLLVRTRFPDSTTLENFYDAAGNRIRTVDHAGRVTRYEYDALNRLTATIYPDDTPLDETDNPRRQTVYDAVGRMIAMIDENGQRTDYEYDAADRRIRVISPAVVDGASGEVKRPSTQFEYDSAGRQTAVIDPNGNRTQFERDPVGHITHTTFADGTSTGQQFDATGRLAAVEDQAGQTTRYVHDAVGRLIEVQLPAPVTGQAPLVTRYTYDEAGNRMTDSDALGHTTTLTYDELNRITTRQRPSGVTESFVYDAVGNQTRHTDFNGATTQFSYDVMNRLVRKDYPDSTFVVTTYTPTGQIATETDSRGLMRYEYDERDRLLSRTEPDGRSIAYTYDVAGNRLSVSSPGATTRYAYDALNRITTVTDSRSGLTTYQYDLQGNLLQTAFPNGVVETRGYDELNRVKSVRDSGPAGLLDSFEYTFDPVGRQTSVVESNGRRVDYAYDLTGRLVTETISMPGSTSQSITFAYDAVGNRLSRTDSAAGQTTYEYNADNELLREVTGGQVTTSAYDNNGNTISIVSPTERRLLAWDAENRLVGITLTDTTGTHEIHNQYNPAGLRVSQTVDGQETRYLVDELLGFGEVLEEYNPTGATLADYTYGIDLIAQERDGQTVFFQTDGQGSTRLLTDLNAAAVDRYFYQAYGQIAEQSGDTINPYLYRGEQFDPLANAYYLRARFYDAETGRLLSTDPMAGHVRDPRTFQLYVYANSDPVNGSDPSGEYTLLQLQVGLGIVSVITGIAVGEVLMRAGLNPYLSVGIAAAVAAAVYCGGYVLLAGFAADAPAVQSQLQSPVAQNAINAANSSQQQAFETAKRLLDQASKRTPQINLQVTRAGSEAHQRFVADTTAAMDQVRAVLDELPAMVPSTAFILQMRDAFWQMKVTYANDPEWQRRIEVGLSWINNFLLPGRDPYVAQQ